MRRTLTTLLCAVALLLAFGLVLLYSASMAQRRTPHFFIERQLLWLLIGGLAAFALARIDYRLWRSRVSCGLLALCSLAGLLGVFAFPKTNGSHRWINLGGFSLQPSEFTKLAAIILMAVWLAHIGPKVRQFWKGAVIPGAGLALLLALLLAEPDFGSTVVVAVVGAVILFVAGTRFVYLLLGGGAAIGAIGAMLWLDPVRRERLRVFLEGKDSASTAAHQLRQSINAFISGGPWGVGLNHSIQKYHYLPEAHTDFIFAIAGEELGLAATLGVVLLFLVILGCGVAIAYRAADRFGRLLAIGATSLLVFEAGFNIGVVTGLLPTKGLALPFISYGGSSLIASLMAVGLLVNIARHADSDEARPVRNALQRV